MSNKAEGEMLDHENKMMAKFKAERAKKSKQVIVMRTDLNMRKGKMVAQGAHASMKALLDIMNKDLSTTLTLGRLSLDMTNGSPLQDWLGDKFTKICVKGESEAHIKELYEKAKAAGIPCSLILDAGLTEFNEPTYTCVAIGPGWSEDVDKITGGLSLL